MALIKCPECGKKISDKSTVCVHCGCPLSAIENISNNQHQNIIDNDNKTSRKSKKIYFSFLQLLQL